MKIATVNVCKITFTDDAGNVVSEMKNQAVGINGSAWDDAVSIGGYRRSGDWRFGEELTSAVADVVKVNDLEWAYSNPPGGCQWVSSSIDDRGISTYQLRFRGEFIARVKRDRESGLWVAEMAYDGTEIGKFSTETEAFTSINVRVYELGITNVPLGYKWSYYQLSDMWTLWDESSPEGKPVGRIADSRSGHAAELEITSDWWTSCATVEDGIAAVNREAARQLAQQ